MFRPVSLYIGGRYIGLRSGAGALLVMPLVAISGLALGVALLVVVLSVMNGFDRELRERVMSLIPHAALKSNAPIDDWKALASTLRQHPQVVAAAPFASVRGILVSGEKSSSVVLYGVEPETERKASQIERHIVDGDFGLLNQGPGSLLIGAELADRLGLERGDALRMLSPGGQASQSDRTVLAMRLHPLRVAGFFDTGSEFDRNVAIVSLADALAIAASAGVSDIKLRFKDLFAAPYLSASLARKLNRELGEGSGKFVASNWTRSHGNLYQAIQYSKKVVSWLLLIVIAVACFNMVSCLVMLVDEKRGAISTLRALGLPPRSVVAIFIVQGTLLGALGCLIGAVLGMLLAWAAPPLAALLENALGLRLLETDIYPVNYLPVEVSWADIAMVCSASMALSMIASIYPAWRAGRVHPATVLRDE